MVLQARRLPRRRRHAHSPMRQDVLFVTYYDTPVFTFVENTPATVPDGMRPPGVDAYAFCANGARRMPRRTVAARHRFQKRGAVAPCRLLAYRVRQVCCTPVM